MNRLKFIMQQQWQDTINLFTVGSTNQVVDLVFTFCESQRLSEMNYEWGQLELDVDVSYV